MPKSMHRKLARTARRRGYKGARYRRYVYGTMAKRRKKR